MAYTPLKIAGFETGLVQDREKFLLVDDAFPVLENAYIWREKILKKRGKESYGRLRRVLTSQSLAATAASDTYSVADVLTSFRANEPNAQFELASFTITLDPAGGSETILEDEDGDGTLNTTATNALNATGGTINYITGAITVTFSAPIAGGLTVEADYAYFPSLPCMGLKTRELSTINSEDVIGFDTRYAYQRSGQKWIELASGTTWQGNNSQFFWTSNFWVDANNNKLFWATNFTNPTGTYDPMRYFDGTSWNTFEPNITVNPPSTSEIKLFQALMLIPFRGRMLALNTFEGTSAAASVQLPQRIRWAAIGNPIDSDSWRQDIRGKGSFLDIPTSQNIVAAGFVRDNLVIYCERSTWQLRYTGRSISPFQIERVNSELGSESTFSAVPFDTSLVGIGDKRIVSCNSFSSEPIDIKIPDFSIRIENENNGRERVHGVRDIVPRLTYWTYPSVDKGEYQDTFPNRILLYNYENESWGIFKDSVTVFGYTWISEDPAWDSEDDTTWEEADFTWGSFQAEEPFVISGNQQGYTHKMFTLTANEPSLSIKGITGNTTTPTTLTVINHNLSNGDIVKIVNIPTGTPFASSLNDTIFAVFPTDSDTLELYLYDSETNSWNVTPQLDASATYIGYGELTIRDNFSIRTKKFHHMDEGQKIQIGYVDVLLDATTSGKITANFYVDYKDTTAVNQVADTFFNRTVPTSGGSFDVSLATKYWHRIQCPVRGNFLQLELTLSNLQMSNDSAISDVVLGAMIIWERLGGRLTI